MKRAKHHKFLRQLRKASYRPRSVSCTLQRSSVRGFKPFFPNDIFAYMRLTVSTDGCSLKKEEKQKKDHQNRIKIDRMVPILVSD